MGVLSKEQTNNALLGLYLGTWGPKTLRKCITDKLFEYKMLRNENTIRNKLAAEMVPLAFPGDHPVPSLDDLYDLVVPDIGSLAFDVSTTEQDISKLRNTIQCLLEGHIFHEYLQSRRKRFCIKRLLSKIQFAKLYPKSGDCNIFDLDITILCFILFEGMDFKPVSDFDKLPLETHTEEADDMLRIKICRNILVHLPVPEISDGDFDTYWECLTGAFERLFKSPSVRQESEELKRIRLSDAKVDELNVMIQEWRMDDADEQRKQVEQVKNIVTQTGARTESVIKATGTQIVDNQNVKHEELVTLLKQNTCNTKRLKVQNKVLEKSYPVWVYGYDQFKQVCHHMDGKGIKYTLPTSSSTDTSTNSDSSSGNRSSDPELIQSDRARADSVDKEHCIDNKCRASNASSDIPTDSTTHTNKVADVRHKTHWKRHSKENNSRGTQVTRRPRSRNDMCTGDKDKQTARMYTDCSSPYDVSDADDEDDSMFLSCRWDDYFKAERDLYTHASTTMDTMLLSSNKSGNLSGGNPTNYNADLLSLISTVDGNLASNALLCEPVRPELPLSIQREKIQLPRPEECFINSSDALPYATDDGYNSNGYFSSLERRSSCMQHRHAGLPNNGTAAFFADGKSDALPNATDDGYNSNGYFSSLDRRPSSTQCRNAGLPTLQGYSTSASFGKEGEPDNGQEIPVSGKGILGEPLLGSCLSINTSRQFERLQLSGNQRQDRDSLSENKTDRRDILHEIFV